MITTVLSFIVVLGFLIFIHELGTTLRLGTSMFVSKLSPNFPPKMTGFRRGKRIANLLDSTWRVRSIVWAERDG